MLLMTGTKLLFVTCVMYGKLRHSAVVCVLHCIKQITKENILLNYVKDACLNLLNLLKLDFLCVPIITRTTKAELIAHELT